MDVRRADDDVRVFVVDDQPFFLVVAREVIEATSGFQAVGCARSGEAALDWLRGREADLVIIDVRMPGADGAVAAREVATLENRPVVVLCSSDDRPDIAADPGAHGADTFCCKERFGAGFLREIWARYGASRPVRASARP
jgi:two-component system, NarL family, invasion response regulator UvrY